MRILFAGGGTGGHLYPALALAHEMESLDADCTIEFVGTRYGIEAKKRESLGYRLNLISMRGLPRQLSPGLLAWPFRLVLSFIQSRKLLRRFQPDVVVGTGGYVAGPVLYAAAMNNIPSVIQEQNSYPGLVTRKLASRANLLFVAYKSALDHLPQGIKAETIGNPIRSSVTQGKREEALKNFGLRSDRKTILILGGSQGARRINEAVLKNIEALDDSVQLLWQCGKRDYKDVAKRLNKKDFVISLFPFSENMAEVYAAADIAIARAGALTLAELTACGLPSILIPYPFAAADHQRYNAESVCQGGAAEMIADADLEQVNLIECAIDLLNSEKFDDMRSCAKAMGQPDAARVIASKILQLAKDKGERVGN